MSSVPQIDAATYKKIAEHDQRADEVLRPLRVVCILFMVLNTLFVVLRFISRNYVKKLELGLDDIMIIPSWICNIGTCTLGLLIMHYMGLGNPPAHLPVILPEQIEPILKPTLKSTFALAQIAAPAYTLPKLSLGFLYLRIFTSRWFRIAAYTIMFLSVSLWIGYALGNAFICSPTAYYWDRSIPGGSCRNVSTLFLAIQPPNVLLDAALLILPIPAVWRLQISKLRKTGLTTLFCTGFIALAASCARWAVFTHYDFEDLAPYIVTPLITTTILEPSLYLLVACLPAMYPLISALTPRWVRRHLNSGIRHARQKRSSGQYQLTRGRGGAPIRIKGGTGLPGYAGGTGPHDAFARLDDGGVAHVFSAEAGAKGGRDVAVISPFTDRGTAMDDIGRSGNRSRASERGGGVTEVGVGGRGEVDMATGLEMEDLRRLRLGEGIVVQTEIEVTASERVERVVGF